MFVICVYRKELTILKETSVSVGYEKFYSP